MRNVLGVFAGKLTYWLTQVSHLGAGGTWPGEIALTFAPNLLQSLNQNLKKGFIIVAGTNGKTTTSLMIKQILEKNGEIVVHNATGANLLNGVVSALIQKADWKGNIEADWGVFEVDENSLPLVTRELINYSSSEPQTSREVFTENNVSSRLRSNNKLIIVLLNLFRDQLDRYGEVDVIAERWEKALEDISRQTSVVRQYKNMTLILNADDPLIAHLGKVFLGRVTYFGVDNPKEFLPKLEHATDSIFCLNCGDRLKYSGIYYSHIGIWRCEKCRYKRPKPDITTGKSPLPGLYNYYNTLAAISVTKELDYSDPDIEAGLADFSPAFGRQEEFEVDGKKIKIFLSKNPAGFNQSLKTVLELGARQILFVLNDRIPDGRDVSWIWDVDFEQLPAWISPVVSGDRVYDLAVRLKYAKSTHRLPEGAVSEPEMPIIIYEDLRTALRFCINERDKDTALYIMPTYSAMLEVRKILRGRTIL